jgi:hypothetical protein
VPHTLDAARYSYGRLLKKYFISTKNNPGANAFGYRGYKQYLFGRVWLKYVYLCARSLLEPPDGPSAVAD